jgi:hypothetical protein
MKTDGKVIAALIGVMCGLALMFPLMAVYRMLTIDRAVDAEVSRVRRVERMTDYCLTVSAALEMDARDLASSDPSRRVAAAQRFGELVTYHSEPEILLCSNTPPDLRARDACWIANDHACLSRLARAAAAATKGRP